MRRRNLPRVTSILAGVGLCASAAQAVPMPPGSFISPLPGTTSVLEPQLTGALIVQDVTRNFSGTFTGNNLPWEVNIRDRVILATDGTYDFYYSVESVEMPAAYPLTLRRDGFAAFSPNVGWREDSAGTAAPQSASRTLDGDTIQFNFDNGAVAEGVTTRLFFVDTDATDYALNSEAILDLSPAFNIESYTTFATFGPAVPEPSILAALAGLALVRRRR